MSKPGLCARWVLPLMLQLRVKPLLPWVPPLPPDPLLGVVSGLRLAAPRLAVLLTRSPAIAAPAAILFFSACATLGPPHRSYVNPEDCSPIVEAHRLDPSRSVDAPPKPMGIHIPPARDLRGVAQVEMVVMEDGFVLRNSIQVVGTDIGTTIREIQEAAAKWRFQPARVGICWVPAVYQFKVTRGSSSPSGPRESLTPAP